MKSARLPSSRHLCSLYALWQELLGGGPYVHKHLTNAGGCVYKVADAELRCENNTNPGANQRREKVRLKESVVVASPPAY